jgi:hypothetical protein
MSSEVVDKTRALTVLTLSEKCICSRIYRLADIDAPLANKYFYKK